MNEEISQDYSAWLNSYHWDYFFTITFRKARRDPQYALQHSWNILEQSGACRSFIVAEPHQSGDLHTHGIVSGPEGDWLPKMQLPYEVWNRLHHTFGRSRITPCRNQNDVSAYCSKYVTKALDVGDHYGIFGDKFWWNNAVRETI